MPVYWVEYGPANFLWASDIALFLTLLAVWLESRLVISMMALAVLPPEIGWCIDFIFRLSGGLDVLPFDGTRYMFDDEIPALVRGLSLFHVFLPMLLLWLLARFGYDSKALLCQTLMAWLILPLSYVVTTPSQNVNWVYGFGPEPQALMPGPAYLAVLMVSIPIVLYVPTHYLLGWLFPLAGGQDRAAEMV